MNTQERDQLSQFLQQLAAAKLGNKDQDAANMIAETVARQPDAAYLLVQRAMLLDQALNTAKAQINDLQNQLQTSRSGNQGGFLNNDPWAQPAAPSGQVPGAGGYQMPRPAAAPASGGFLGGGASSFLGNVATTAAGVVAGSFLFQGIENLLGHHGGSAWGQGGYNDGLMSGEHVTEQFTTVNNYYGSADDAGNFQTASYDDNGDDVSDDDSFQNDGESDWM